MILLQQRFCYEHNQRVSIPAAVNCSILYTTFNQQVVLRKLPHVVFKRYRDLSNFQIFIFFLIWTDKFTNIRLFKRQFIATGLAHLLLSNMTDLKKGSQGGRRIPIRKQY